jgi:alpha-galactosidase
MSEDETAFAMLSGIVGRLYLSGFLHRLGDAQRALVDEAVVVHKRWREFIASSTPAWPLGLPAWDDTALALRLNGPSGALLAVWSRHHGADILLPGIESLTQLYPRAATPWAATATAAAGTRLSLPDGIAARLFAVGV